MLNLVRLVPVCHRFLAQRRAQGPQSNRRATPRHRLQLIAVLLAAVCVVGAAAGWMLSGGTLTLGPLALGQRELVVVSSATGIPIHIDSSPAGAQVRIDGAPLGKTPLDVALSAGQHDLSLQHPEALDEERTLPVSDAPASIDVSMWRRRPEVVAIRPVYPGASLMDARFLNDGQVALVVRLPVQAAARDAARALWLLDPATGQLRMVDVPGLDADVPSIALSPDGDHVAYVRSGTDAPVTTTGWQASSTSSHGVTPQPDWVWMASTLSNMPPRRLFELPATRDGAHAASAERIVDLIWTPDGSRLVSMAREPEPPVRTRIFLLSLAPGDDVNEPTSEELVTLPADVLVGSATTDPDGRWLAFLATAPAAGGNNPLSLCVVELRSGGAFRDIADLGADAAAPVSAPVTWTPSADSGAGQLVFVGPVPAAPSSSGGLFGIFGALRPSAPASGLFALNLEASTLQTSQPKRLGRAINNFGPIWRNPTTLYVFARQDDGSLALHSADPNSGTVTDLGVRLSAGGAQDATGLSARWDTRDGYALLLARAPAGAPSRSPTDPAPLRAWLVSFTPPTSPDVPH